MNRLQQSSKLIRRYNTHRTSEIFVQPISRGMIKGWLKILNLMHFFLMFRAILSLRVMTFTAQSFRIIAEFGTLTTVCPGLTNHQKQNVAERSLEI